MNTAMWGALAVVGFVLVGTISVQHLHLRSAEAALAAETIRADFLSANAAAERARAEGLEVALVASQQGAVREAMARDSMLADLGEDLEASRVRVTELTRLVSEASGGGTSEADSVNRSGETVESFAGRFDDGYLTALWRAHVPETSLELQYQTRDTLRLVRGVTGDGRVWFSARPSHPNARATVDTLFVDLPEPEVVTRSDFWRDVRLGLLAGAGGVILGAVAR